jgi:hypothetical protein
MKPFQWSLAATGTIFITAVLASKGLAPWIVALASAPFFCSLFHFMHVSEHFAKTDPSQLRSEEYGITRQAFLGGDSDTKAVLTAYLAGSAPRSVEGQPTPQLPQTKEPHENPEDE